LIGWTSSGEPKSHEVTKNIERIAPDSCLRDFVVNNSFYTSAFPSIATCFALFTADLAAAPGLGHAVSFPFACIENIHHEPERLANAHLSGRLPRSICEINHTRPEFFPPRLAHPSLSSGSERRDLSSKE
jgi:hypothetical protein